MSYASSRHLAASAFLLIFATIAAAQAPATPPLKVTLLGTGSPRPVMERFGPSILVQAGKQQLLFDCGRGASQRVEQLSLPFARVDALFLTHLHSDHVVGIPDLWLTGWIRGRSTPFRVWGPAGTKDMMSHLEEAYAFDIHMRRDIDERLPAQGVAVAAKDVGEGLIYDHDGVKVTAFLVDHGLVKPALGYRVDFAGHSVVLSGDTRYSENLIKFSQGVDVLVHEVIDPESFQRSGPPPNALRPQSIIAHHTTAEQAGTVFTRVKPKLAVFSHIVPWDAKGLVPTTRKTYAGPLKVGEDLMTIEIGDVVTVHRPANGTTTSGQP